MDYVIEVIKNLDLAQLIAMGIMLWFFYSRLDSKIEKLSERMVSVEKEIQQLNTRIAVIESRIDNISTNVTHLMWQHQAISHKEADEK